MWDEIYKKYAPELLRYACAACKNPAEAEDLIQEIFLKALQNCDTFLDLGPNQRRAWLYRALKNEMCDRYRRAKLEDTYLQTQEGEQTRMDPGMEQVETALLLQKLSPEDQALFTLRYIEGYTAVEISQMLHIPSGTIRSRLSRYRVLLKHNLTL